MSVWCSKDGTVELHLSDCREALIGKWADTCITDPPYGLSFMGKEWDRGVPGHDFWFRVLLALKPGATLLAFGGTRTHHRLMCAIEDAGFEIRDTLMWLYGSGFPKSLDISKAIDKAAGAERSDSGVGQRETQNALSGRSLGNRCPECGKPRFSGNPCRCPRAAPVTEAADLWDGWGTALKPAFEPIIMAMKPLDGTFAANALEHGVAGLNVDGCRIPTQDGETYNTSPASSGYCGIDGYELGRGRCPDNMPAGRWPANVILDEEAGALLDEQSGPLRARGNVTPADTHAAYDATSYRFGGKERGNPGDSGGASRFFYCAKASRSERTHNGSVENRHPTVKPIDLMRYLCRLTKTPTGGTVLDPFMGTGSTGLAAIAEGRKFIGIEQDEEAFETAVSRFKAEGTT